MNIDTTNLPQAKFKILAGSTKEKNQMKWEKKIEKYVEEHQNILSPSSLKTYPSKLRKLASYDFNPHVAFQEMVEDGYSRYSIEIYFMVARSFEKWIERPLGFKEFENKHRHLFENAYQAKKHELTEAEVLQIMEESARISPIFYSLCWLMAFSGLRFQEALSASPKRLSDCELTIVGKRSKQRTVLIDPRQLHTWITTGKPIEKILNATRLRRWMDQVGVRFTPHDLRAFFIQHHLRNKKISPKDVQLLVGHKNIETTMQYDTFNIERIKKASIEGFNDIYQKLSGEEVENDRQKIHGSDGPNDRGDEISQSDYRKR